MRQADIFLQGEADAWFERNRDRLGECDPVSEAIEKAGIVPARVLEVGSSNGWRLIRLRRKYHCFVAGIEPSDNACTEAMKNNVRTDKTTADSLPKNEPSFDLLIYGFCLYVTDPAEWFRIVSEGDRVLADSGHIIIHDFDAKGQFFARNYRHRKSVIAYHFDFSKLWLAHPWYHVVQRRLDEVGDSITILKKVPHTAVRP